MRFRAMGLAVMLCLLPAAAAGQTLEAPVDQEALLRALLEMQQRQQTPLPETAPPQPGPPQDPNGGSRPQQPPSDLSGLGRAGLQALCDVRVWERGQRALSQTDFACLDWRAEVSWIRPDGGREGYRDWPQARKDRLDRLFMQLLTEEPVLDVNCPAAPIQVTSNLSEATAEGIYLVHVAHALLLEREQRTPWRLHAMPAAERAAILAPEAYVSRVWRTGTGVFDAYTMIGGDLALDCDPRVGFQFMTGAWLGQPQSLMGATELETLRNLTAWARSNLGHGDYNHQERVDRPHLAQRLTRYGEYNTGVPGYWAPGGCHDAVHTLADLARAVNIPLLRTWALEEPPTRSDHAGLVWGWARLEPRVLWHVDLAYAQDQSLFPVDAAGAALLPAAADQAFFDAVWVTPATLTAYGFVYDLRRLAAGEAGDESVWSLDFRRYRLGEWAASPTPGRYSQGFDASRSFLIAGGRWLTEECLIRVNAPTGRDASGWQDYLDRTGAVFPPALSVTGAMAAQRVDQAIAAYGGCAGVRAILARNSAYRTRPL